MNDPVAKKELIAVHPAGSRSMVTIEIGMPYLREVDKDLEDWACPVSLSPLYNNLAEARGGDSFQALSLAVSLILDLLSGLKAKGWNFLIDEEEEFPLEAYSFGRMKRDEVEMDDGKRATDGVVACIRDEGDKIRLIFDDVESAIDVNPIAWAFRTFFPWNAYDKDKLLDSELTDEQYQEIGFNLVARLVAIHKTRKDGKP
jgi:hypothetical protein